MKYSKEELENAVKGSINKTDVFKKLGIVKRDYKTLNKYIDKYKIDCSHLKPHCTSIEHTNSLKIYSKGDKHPNKDLYFWQYRYNRKGTKSFELWYDKESFEKANIKWKDNNKKYREKDILAHLVRTSLLREKNNKRHNEKDELITLDYVKDLWQNQKGLCFWFKIPMRLNKQNGSNTDLLKVSIDRIDSSKGYVKGNIVLSCLFANRGKGNSKNEEWLDFLKLIKNE